MILRDIGHKALFLLTGHSVHLINVSILLSGPSPNGTEQIGIEKQTPKLCWNINVQHFTEFVFV